MASDRSATPSRRGCYAIVATALTAALAMVHGAWTLGERWGYSACGHGSLSRTEAATGCGADRVADVGPVDGWVSAAGWAVAALVAAGCVRWGPRMRPLAMGAAGVILVVNFPLHLLFEIPVGLAGEPTDWRQVAGRVMATAAGIALLAAVRGPRCPHRTTRGQVVTLPRWGRVATYVGAATPLFGWLLPHAAWMANIRLGISAETLREAHELPVAAQAAVTLVPVLGVALTVGLIRPWGQQVPGWVPGLGGRAVPRLVAMGAGGGTALLLGAYGLIGLTMMVHDVASRSSSVEELATSWAVVLTEVVFLVWGLALAVAVVAYAGATRCPWCVAARAVQSGRSVSAEPGPAGLR